MFIESKLDLKPGYQKELKKSVIPLQKELH